MASTLNLDGWPDPAVPLACSSCHGEHQGANASLKAMSDQKCQACHAAVFQKFESDHPDFSSFPYARRTRLIFDHNSHMNKHFKESEEIAARAPGKCRSCHALDQSGRFMTVSSFETVCASCHEPQILGKGSAGDKGISFFAVPGLDGEALKKAKIDIGHWPEKSEVEEVPPFIHLLLMADPDYPAIRAKLKDLDLLDLSEAEKSRKEAVGKLAWSIKKLLFELTTDGQQGLRRRLEAAIGRPLTESELSKLTAQFPVDLVRAAQKAWFPGLGAEIARMEKGDKKPARKPNRKKQGGKEEPKDDTEEKTSAESASIVGGWYLQDFVLFYRPSGHQDRFLLGWLELTGSGQFSSAQENRPAIFEALSNRKAPGMCAKCHSIDKAGERGFRVNWSPRQPALNVRDFTIFSHAPHFSLLDEKGCMTCHQLAKDADYPASYKNSDPKTFESNFGSIPKTLCADCHTEGRASNQCLTCHNYHIGHVKPAVKEPSFLDTRNN